VDGRQAGPRAFDRDVGGGQHVTGRQIPGEDDGFAQLFRRGDLGGENLLVPHGHGLFHFAHHGDELGEALRIEGDFVVRAGQGPVQGEMAFDHAGAERRGGHARADALFMTRIPHGLAVAFPQPRQHRQGDLLLGTGVAAVAMQKHEIVVVAPHEGDGHVDLGKIAHAGGEHHGNARGTGLTQQRQAHQIGRAEFEQLHVEGFHLREADRVPGGGEKDQSQLLGQGLGLGHFLNGKFQGRAVLAIGATEAVLAVVGGVAALDGEQGFAVALLELDAIHPATSGLADHLQGHVQLALVVVADFGHDETGMVFTDDAATTQADGFFHNLMTSMPLSLASGASWVKISSWWPNDVMTTAWMGR